MSGRKAAKRCMVKCDQNERERRNQRESKKMDASMNVVCERCCWIDVHKDEITCHLISGQNRFVSKAYGTLTKNLQEMAAWLKRESRVGNNTLPMPCNRFANALANRSARNARASTL